MSNPRHPSRRHVIAGVAASSGGLVLGLVLPARAQAPRQAAGDLRFPINAWLIVRPDETVVVRIAKADLGQGTVTGLAQLVAEELACDWSRVVTELARPGEALAKGWDLGGFATASSRGIRSLHELASRAGAVARQMLLAAAAEQWKVPPIDLSVSKGVVTHPPTRRSTTYGRLAALAATLPPPSLADVPLKNPKTWTIVGQRVTQAGIMPKLTGRAVYGIDVRLPGMLSAAIEDAPVFGSNIASFDAAAVQSMPGVRHVLRVGATAVAVVADTWWQARKALAALPVSWEPSPNGRVTSASIANHLKEGLQGTDAFIGHTHGDALKAIAGATKRLEAVYSLPYLHQAPLEPMNCTALWTPERLEVWAPTQNADAAMRIAAQAGGLPVEAVEVNRCLVGGAFGRRIPQDYVEQAVLIARQVPGTPVKLIWSREEDMTNGFYKPAIQCKLNGGIDDKGEVVGLIVRLSGQSILATHHRLPGQQVGRDARMFQGLYAESGEAQIGYSIPNIYIDHAVRSSPVPVGSWRGVHSNHNAIFLECFIDEMAHAAGRDPYDFRRAMMRSRPRHLAVLRAAAERAGWGTASPQGQHKGIAHCMAYGSYVAAVAEVSVDAAGQVRVHRLVIALDCGHVVNPDQVTAQIEGSVAFALGAVLDQEITIESGRVVQRNFDHFPIPRLAAMPAVEAVLVPSGEDWGGVGEAVTPVIAPAILNAIHAATGKRVRTLPLKNVKLI